MAGEDHHLTDDAEHMRLQKALRESIILRELANILNSSLDLEQILQELVKRTTELCEVKRCAVWLLEETSAESSLRPVTYYLTETLANQGLSRSADAVWYSNLIASAAPLIKRLLAEDGVLLIHDLHTEAVMRKYAEKLQIHSVLLIALIREGRPVGVMSLDNPGQSSTFSQDQQHLARAIAHQATIAIDNARLYQRAQRQQSRAEHLIERARAIYHVAMTVNSGEELRTILKLATSYLVQNVGASDGLTMLLEPDATRLNPVTPERQKLLAPSLELQYLPNFQQAIETGKPALVTAEQARDEEQSWFRLLHLKSLLLVPLMVGTPNQGINWELSGEPPGTSGERNEGAALPPARCMGLIAIHYMKRRKPSRGEYAFAQDIAAQCAHAIEKTHLLAETHRTAELATIRANTLDIVCQAVTEAIIVIKPDGQLEVRNDSAARFLGIPLYSSIPLETLLHQYPTFTLDGHSYTFENFPIFDVLSGNLQISGKQLSITRADGSRRMLEVTTTRLQENENQPAGLVMAFRDITSQVMAEQRVRQALDAFLYIAEAISRSTDIREILYTTLAKTLTTLHCRRGMVHLFPQDQQTFQHALSLGFSPEEEKLWLKEQESWLDEENGLIYGFYEKIISGQATLISAASSPLQPNPFAQTLILAAPIKHDQQILGLILLDRSHLLAHHAPATNNPSFTNWDITIVEGIAQLAGTAMEQARWQQAAIQARANEDMMREADAMKNEFLAMTAHEFRTPLAVILMRSQGTLRTLRRSRSSSAEAPPSPIEEHLEIIAAQAKQLNNIVTTFLDTARIQQGQFTLQRETVDLVRIVRQIIEDQTHLVEKHELHYELQQKQASYLVIGDPARLSQVIANLVENAIKYSPLGGKVTVLLSRHPDDPTQIDISVFDRGIGIPPEAQDRLFERFYRVPNTIGGEARGVGLGLYIVAQLVQMHKGSIRVESEGIPGQGSCFIITLPALPDPSREEAKQRASEGEL